MSRTRSAPARAARLQRGRAALGVSLLALAACGTAEPEAPPPPCPTAMLLDGAERTSAYRAGAEARPSELRYLALLTDLGSTCRYVDDGVDVDLSFIVIAERGPALAADEEVTYFVATVGPGEQILAKEVLGGELGFAEGEQRVVWNEDLTLRLPAVTPVNAADYRLYVGFQLDEAELRRREQPLLR